MKKFLLFFAINLFTILPCLAGDFNTKMIEINNAITNGKYEKALKLIKKTQDLETTNKDQLEVLSQKADIAREKLNTQNFWSNYKIENDNFLHVVRYYPKHYTIYPLKLIIVKDKDNNLEMYANFEIVYLSGTFLSAQSVVFEKGNNLTFQNLQNKEFKVVSCGILGCTYCENFKYKIQPSDIENLRAVANASNTKYRVYGTNHYKDFALTDGASQALIRMLDLYDHLAKTNL